MHEKLDLAKGWTVDTWVLPLSLEHVCEDPPGVPLPVHLET